MPVGKSGLLGGKPNGGNGLLPPIGGGERLSHGKLRNGGGGEGLFHGND